MMQKLLLLTFLFFSLIPSYAQSELLSYSQIISDTSSKGQLYERAKSWIAKSFSQPKEVVQMDDREAGMIVLHYFTEVKVKEGILNRLSSTGTGKCWCMLTLNFKVNKWKYELTNIGGKDRDYFHVDEKMDAFAKDLKNYRKACIEQMGVLQANLKTAMATTTDF